MSTVWLDGRLARGEEARVSVFDRGFLRGDGVFDTFRTYAGRPFGFREHLARLERSARLVGLALPAHDWRAIVRDVLRANALHERDAAVRITLTAGVGGEGVSRRGASGPTVLVTATPVAYPPNLYTEGVNVIVSTRTRRMPPEVLDPRIKSLAYLPNVLARLEAEERGAFDALVLTLDGRVAEGTVSNVVAVLDGELATPPVATGVLDGITRATVLALAREAGYVVAERDFRPEDLREADEIFLTSSVAEILPVARFEDRPVGRVQPGPVARRLLAAYRAHVRDAVAREA